MLTRCPACSKRLNVPDTSRGRRIRCPKCSAVSRLDENAEEEPVPIAQVVTSRNRKGAPPPPNDDEPDDGDEEAPAPRVTARGAGDADESRARRKVNFASLIQR